MQTYLIVELTCIFSFIFPNELAFIKFCFDSLDRILLCSADWLWTHYVALAVPRLMPSCLSLPPKSWNFRHGPPCPANQYFWKTMIKYTAYMLKKLAINKLLPTLSLVHLEAMVENCWVTGKHEGFLTR